MNNSKRAFIAFLIFTLAASVTFAADKNTRKEPSPKDSDQDTPAGQRPERVRSRDMMPGGGPEAGAVGPGLFQVFSVLTPEQRQSLRAQLQEDREKVKALEPKIMDARKKLIESAVSEKFNEKAVRKQARAIAELESERTILFARALSKIEPPLTEAQKRQLQEPPRSRPEQPWRGGRFDPDGQRFGQPPAGRPFGGPPPGFNPGKE